MGGARTDLSGLTAPEARAVFLVAGPASEGAPAVRSALRKLVLALPEPFRLQAEAAAPSVHVDAVGWGRRAEAVVPCFLDPLQQAVIDGVQVELGYVARDGRASTRTVHPLGVVSKGASWYLVAGTDRGRRLFRIDRVTDLVITDRPPAVRLTSTWQPSGGPSPRRSTKGSRPSRSAAWPTPSTSRSCGGSSARASTSAGRSPDGVEVVRGGARGSWDGPRGRPRARAGDGLPGPPDRHT